MLNNTADGKRPKWGPPPYGKRGVSAPSMRNTATRLLPNRPGFQFGDRRDAEARDFLADKIEVLIAGAELVDSDRNGPDARQPIVAVMHQRVVADQRPQLVGQHGLVVAILGAGKAPR